MDDPFMSEGMSEPDSRVAPEPGLFLALAASEPNDFFTTQDIGQDNKRPDFLPTSGDFVRLSADDMSADEMPPAQLTCQLTAEQMMGMSWTAEDLSEALALPLPESLRTDPDTQNVDNSKSLTSQSGPQSPLSSKSGSQTPLESLKGTPSGPQTPLLSPVSPGKSPQISSPTTPLSPKGGPLTPKSPHTPQSPMATPQSPLDQFPPQLPPLDSQYFQDTCDQLEDYEYPPGYTPTTATNGHDLLAGILSPAAPATNSNVLLDDLGPRHESVQVISPVDSPRTEYPLPSPPAINTTENWISPLALQMSPPQEGGFQLSQAVSSSQSPLEAEVTSSAIDHAPADADIDQVGRSRGSSPSSHQPPSRSSEKVTPLENDMASDFLTNGDLLTETLLRHSESIDYSAVPDHLVSEMTEKAISDASSELTQFVDPFQSNDTTKVFSPTDNDFSATLQEEAKTMLSNLDVTSAGFIPTDTFADDLPSPDNASSPVEDHRPDDLLCSQEPEELLPPTADMSSPDPFDRLISGNDHQILENLNSEEPHDRLLMDAEESADTDLTDLAEPEKGAEALEIHTSLDNEMNNGADQKEFSTEITDNLQGIDTLTDISNNELDNLADVAGETPLEISACTPTATNLDVMADSSLEKLGEFAAEAIDENLAETMISMGSPTVAESDAIADDIIPDMNELSGVPTDDSSLIGTIYHYVPVDISAEPVPDYMAHQPAGNGAETVADTMADLLVDNAADSEDMIGNSLADISDVTASNVSVDSHTSAKTNDTANSLVHTVIDTSIDVSTAVNTEISQDNTSVKSPTEEFTNLIADSKTYMENGDVSAAVETEFNDVKATVETKIDDVESAVDTEIDDVKATVETEFNDVQATKETKIDDVKATVETEFNDVKAAVDTEIGDVKATVDTEIGDVKATVNTEIGDVKATVDTEIGDVKATVETEIDDVKAAVDNSPLGEEITSQFGDDFLSTGATSGGDSSPDVLVPAIMGQTSPPLQPVAVVIESPPAKPATANKSIASATAKTTAPTKTAAKTASKPGTAASKSSPAAKPATPASKSSPATKPATPASKSASKTATSATKSAAPVAKTASPASKTASPAPKAATAAKPATAAARPGAAAMKRADTASTERARKPAVPTAAGAARTTTAAAKTTTTATRPASASTTTTTARKPAVPSAAAARTKLSAVAAVSTKPAVPAAKPASAASKPPPPKASSAAPRASSRPRADPTSTSTVKQTAPAGTSATTKSTRPSTTPLKSTARPPSSKPATPSSAGKPSPEVKSKIGSLAQANRKPTGGDVKVESRKLEWKGESKVGSLANATHKPKGGEKKIEHQKLDWKAKSKIGSLDNAEHIAGGGEIKIENQKLDWKVESKIGSLDNADHRPGGGDIKIETVKVDVSAVTSKIGSLTPTSPRAPTSPSFASQNGDNSAV